MYSIDKPADDIFELMNYLKENDHDDYIYRGQNCHYNTLLPSALRKLISGLEPIDWVNIIGFEKMMKLERTNQEKAKVDTKYHFIHIFGRGIGNILCQQYGLSSDALDFTTDIEIAAFFATRKYPFYNIIDSEDIGVIYRYPRPKSYNSLLNIEFDLSAVGVKADSFKYDDMMWFEERLDINGLLIMGNKKKIDWITNEYLTKNGSLPTIFYRRPSIVTYNDFLMAFDELNLSRDFGMSIENSRIKNQKACLFYPALRINGFMPAKIRVDYNRVYNAYTLTPQYAITHGLNSVRNLLSDVKCELFFFKHSSKNKINIKKEDLWPSCGADTILNLIIKLTETACSKYMKDFGLMDIMDYKIGVIDKGYQ